MRDNGDILSVHALDRISWSRLGLWSAAGLVMLSAHVGAAVWALRTPPAEPMQDAAPAAIMIELAAETAAPETEEEEIAPQETESEQAMAAEPAKPAEEPEEPIEPEDVAEPEPVPDAVETPEPEETVEAPKPEETELEPEEPVVDPPEEPEPVEDEVEPVLEAVNVPVPVARPAYTPKRVEKPKPKTQAASKPQQRSAPSQASAKAKIKAKKAPVASARQTSRGSARTISPARWQSRLLAHLERRKRYPSGAKSRREQGTAYVRFTIDANGNVMSARLARSSGFPELDREVVAMVKRASPVPAPPPGINRTITVPVRFKLR